MRHILRVLIGTAAFLLAFSAPAASAGAAAPERIHLEPSTYVFDAGTVCAVPVQYEELSSNGTLKFFDNGSFFGTGAYRVRLTNLDDPTKTLVVNATGPQLFRPERTQFPAHTLFTMFTGVDFMPGFYLATGNLTVERNPDTGGITGIGGVYQLSENLCDLLE
jgi:hypothetical protein